MKNLAGRKDCDRFIRKELNKVSVPIVARDLTHREVPASIAGQLGPFSFERGWCYWVIRGPLPLHVARKLYRHPERDAIRAVGDACGGHPKQYAVRMLNGQEVAPTEEQADWLAFCERKSYAKPDDYIFSDDPKLGQRFVMSYHIDSQAGLRAFVRALRKHLDSN
jgi:hypothetical protein